MPRFLQAVVILVAAALPAAPAAAQAYGVPPELEGVVGRPNIDEAGQQAIRDYVDPLARDLASGQPDAITRAREDLLAPLVAADDISVGFRLIYAERLIGTLTRLIDGNDEIAAIAALRIAGELGTGQSVDLLLGTLDAESPAIRYAGVQALGATLRLIAEGNPALQADRATGIIAAIAGLIAAEPDAFVVDAGVRALGATRNDAALRQAAVEAMAGAMVEQISMRRAAVGDQPAGAEGAAAMLRAVVEARDFFIAIGAGVPSATAEAVLVMTGHAMAYGVALLDAHGGWVGLSADAGQAVDAMLIAAEAVAGLSYLSVSRQQVNEQPILRAVNDKNLGVLESAVDGWVGPNGRICRPPVNADPNDFD